MVDGCVGGARSVGQSVGALAQRNDPAPSRAVGVSLRPTYAGFQQAAGSHLFRAKYNSNILVYGVKYRSNK